MDFHETLPKYILREEIAKNHIFIEYFVPSLNNASEDLIFIQNKDMTDKIKQMFQFSLFFFFFFLKNKKPSAQIGITFGMITND